MKVHSTIGETATGARPAQPRTARDKQGMDRRAFSKTLLCSVASYSLLRALFVREAFGAAVRPITQTWLKRLHEMSLDLKTWAITPSQWQEQMRELLDQVELKDLLELVEFDRLLQDFEYPDLGVHTSRVRFPRLAGTPGNLAFTGKVFGMKKDRAIIPHGHRNMVSCHYVLKGELRLRHYDKLAEDDTHMVIEPTIDQIAGVGSHSSISDERNNIHWLEATTETAFTFDVLVLDLNGKRWEVDNIDPDNAKPIGDNLLRVRKLGVEEALRKYGHNTHHPSAPLRPAG